jgi:hypothetical protein
VGAADVTKLLVHRPSVFPTAQPGKKPPSSVVSTQSATQAASVTALAEEAAKEIRIEPAAIDGLIANYDSNRQLPPSVDRPLLGLAKKQFGLLSSDQKEKLRTAFVDALRKNRPPKPVS